MPTPGVVALVKGRAVCAASVLIVEYVDGLVVDRRTAAEALTHEQRHEIGLELARVLARLMRSTSTQWDWGTWRAIRRPPNGS